MCSSPHTNRKSFNDASAHLFAFSCLYSLKLLTDKKTSKNKVKEKQIRLSTRCYNRACMVYYTVCKLGCYCRVKVLGCINLDFSMTLPKGNS